MRIDEQQARIIKSVVAREFEPDARVWLFGSRADDKRRGGDVDLYVETRHPALLRELRCRVDIEEAIDLHVDLIVAQPGDDRPIARIAKKTRHPPVSDHRQFVLKKIEHLERIADYLTWSLNQIRPSPAINSD